MPAVYAFHFLFFSQLLQLVLAGNGNGTDGSCPCSFDCGNLGKIGFPFTTTNRTDCGVLAIHGCDDPTEAKSIQINYTTAATIWSNVVSVNGSTIFIRNKDLQEHLDSRSCETFSSNYYLLPSSSFASFGLKYNITLFRCNPTLNVTISKQFHIYTGCPRYNIYYSSSKIVDIPRNLAACSRIQLPVKGEVHIDDLFTFLTAEFQIEVQISDVYAKSCLNESSKGLLYRNGNHHKGERRTRMIWVLIVVSVNLGIGVFLLVIYYYGYKLTGFGKHKSFKENNHEEVNPDFEAFLNSHIGPLGIRRYKYSDINKITKSFKEKLGQGGYGVVFKGRLDDGSQVAVKILSESKGNGEEFINEVASISRTSHINIVTLLGFCFEGSKRALVYELLPNGSLEKFIYETNPSMSNHQLDTRILYQIAIGVARGLEYLHRGCNTRILHFDIKPHNILLDENFSPKISDFGLAKICHKKESIVSMLGARGTIGYIAPEVFNRNFGRVSHKSDVYSYGMMVLEMVAGLKNNNVEVDHSSEIYFPHWIYKRLELNEEFALSNISNANDRNLTRKMVIVSLWCIQTNPVDRPTIERVVEMLGGRVETLQIPPKPYLSSPPGSPPRSSTIRVISQY